jgi:adenosine deaminase
VELHLHLDCSLSFNLVKRLIPEISLETYRKSFIAPAKCLDLADYIKRAAAAIELMQTRKNLALVVEDLFQQLQSDNVIYAELRFAPFEHVRLGLTAEEVVEVINHSVETCTQRTGIEAGIILCTLRHYSTAYSMETVKLVEKFTGTRVVGFDIASDEAGYPIDNHVDAFAYAFEKGINCTAHAGEAKGAESVWETLEHFKPKRIGHGVRSGEDIRLLDFLKRNKIHLEVCPTSNIQTNVFDQITDHNIDVLYRKGISLSVNTDCRTISDVTLGSEYELLERIFGWQLEHFFHCNLEAIKHAFCSRQVKLALQEKLKSGFEQASLGKV